MTGPAWLQAAAALITALAAALAVFVSWKSKNKSSHKDDSDELR